MNSFFSNLIKNGFIQVFTTSILNYLIVFCGSILYTKLLGQKEFGIYSFANNIIAFFLLLNGFGAASGVLQFVSKSIDKEAKIAYLKFSLTMGSLFNILLSVGLILYAIYFLPSIKGTRNILLAMAFIPLFRLYSDIIQAYLRANKQNYQYTKFSLLNSCLLLILNVIGCYYAGIKGLIFSTYLSYITTFLISNFIFKLPNFFTKKNFLINRTEFINYSFFITIGNAFSQLIYIFDIIILGYIISDAKVIAVYKVATIIPFALNFIPGVICSFFYPDLVKNSNNLNYIRTLYKSLFKYMFILSISISIISIIFAKFIIISIFGKEYINSILPFQILMFGFWVVASFRIISGNILASLGRAKYAMYINIIIMLLNITISYYLISYFKIVGAAIGVDIIYIIASIIATITLKSILAKPKK